MSISEQRISIPTGTWRVDVVHSSVAFEGPVPGHCTKFGIMWNAPMPDGSLALADKGTLEADLSLVKA